MSPEPAPLCRLEARPEPCALVIFGGSGDLTSRKLFPALARLYEAGGLPERFVIVGAGRSPLGDEDFRRRMREALVAAGRSDPSAASEAAWEALAPHLFYCPVDYDRPERFRDLAALLARLERDFDLGPRRLFHLAVPPTVYAAVVENLGRAGLCATGAGGWCRVVVEKPFGRDLESARDLDAALHRWLSEDQIFRIDHYLAKETFQNVLLFRFANAVFEPVWNRNFVASVSVLSAETLGVEHRAGYYDQAGVLRDMFQNHMMQLMALTALEPPSLFESERVRDEKAKVFRSLRPFNREGGFQDLALGQYRAGTVDGRAVPGYRQEHGVPPDSDTPTFATIRAFIDNWRWQGVPFYLTSGKRLARKLTRMVVQFKEVPHSLFRSALGEHISANRLVIEAYPDQAISLDFQAKAPGARLCLRTEALNFSFTRGVGGPVLDSYEKLLLDCMLGDRMLFLRQDAVELCWGYLTPILQMCETCGELGEHVRPYAAGSWGPERARDLHPGYLRELSL